jgi:hypothetical protein
MIALITAACRSEKAKSPDTVVSTIAPPPAASTPAPTAQPVQPGCEHTGEWSECTLERRLKQQGFVVKRVDEKVSRAGFSPSPAVYMLGSSRLEAFFYESEAELAKDLQKIDTVAAAPKGAAASWPSTPIFIRSANLAAVFLGQNPRQVERLTLAITAGPPQPGSPR